MSIQRNSLDWCYTFDKQEHTRNVVAIPRVQVFDPADEADVTVAASILRTIKVESGSMEPKPMVDWDWDAMFEMCASYECDFKQVAQYPSNFQGERGTVERDTGHNMAVANSWGLFPSTECVYFSQNPGLDAKGCFPATYKVPANDAFWSITVCNGKGYMFSDNNTINGTTAKYNEGGTVTVYYGSEDDCGKRRNRLDITQGWNILMRVYVPSIDRYPMLTKDAGEDQRTEIDPTQRTARSDGRSSRLSWSQRSATNSPNITPANQKSEPLKEVFGRE